VLTAVTNAEVSGKTVRELTDADVTDVLATEAKKRREAATSYDNAGATDRADLERAELAVITGYLPEQLTTDQISEIVNAAVAAVAAEGRSGPAAIGAVMKIVQPKVKGRADGGFVAAQVKAALSS